MCHGSCGPIYNPAAHKGVAASESDHQAGDVGQLTAGPDGVAEVPPPSLSSRGHFYACFPEGRQDLTLVEVTAENPWPAQSENQPDSVW